MALFLRLMVFNGLFFSSWKVSSLLASLCGARFVLSRGCPGVPVPAVVRGCCPGPLSPLRSPWQGGERGSASFAVGSGRGWCFLEEAGTVRAEERASQVSCRVQTWAKALHEQPDRWLLTAFRSANPSPVTRRCASQDEQPR